MQLAQTIKQFKTTNEDEPFAEVEVKTPVFMNRLSYENEESKLITEQISFVNKITSDLNKICEKMELLNNNNIEERKDEMPMLS